jgi:hypothetical protein
VYLKKESESFFWALQIISPVTLNKSGRQAAETLPMDFLDRFLIPPSSESKMPQRFHVVAFLN